MTGPHVRSGRNQGAPGGCWNCVTKTKEHAGDTVSLVYQCRLPLSTYTLHYLTDLLRHHLKAIRSRWRALPPGRIAVIVLAVLRHGQRLADMAAWQGHLRHHHPELALARRADPPAGREGPSPGPRPEEDRPAGRRGRPDRRHPHPHPAPYRGDEPPELLRQASPPWPARPRADRRAGPSGVGIGRPARPHPRHHRRPPRPHPGPPACCGLGAPAYLGFLGLDDDGDDPVVVTGFKVTRARRLAPAEKEANRVLAAGRVPVERGFAHPKNWRPHQAPY